MNKKIVLSLLLCLIISLSFVSCERYPITDLHSIPNPVNSWPYPWYIYDDELNTKGAFEPIFWEGSGVADDIDFDYNHGTYRGRACIKFDWHPKNGETWCGFGLAAVENYTNESERKDMTTSGYTKLKFYIRGKIWEGAKVVINIPRTDAAGGNLMPVDTTLYPITNLSEDTWTEMSINIVQTKDSWNIQKYYLSINIEGANSNGATIYLDDIRFVKD